MLQRQETGEKGGMGEAFVTGAAVFAILAGAVGREGVGRQAREETTGRQRSAVSGKVLWRCYECECVVQVKVR